MKKDIKFLRENSEPQDVELRQKLDHLQSQYEKVFDFNKLRRTVIKGIPCTFVPHRGGGGESCKDGDINIRAEVWRNAIGLDHFKSKMLAKFNSENK